MLAIAALRQLALKFGRRFPNLPLLLISLGGGILMGLTPAPTQAWFCAWIALVPLYFCLCKDENITLKTAFFLGLIWGCGYHGLALFWITGVHPMTWLGVPWLLSLLIAIFCWLFITFWGACLAASWSLLLTFINHKLIQKTKINSLVIIFLRILIATSLWCGLEALWNSGILWWTSLAYTQSYHNLAILQLSKFSGPATITAIIVTINSLLAEALLIKNYQFQNQKKNQQHDYLTAKPILITASFLLLSSHLFGWQLAKLPLQENQENAIQIGIIQGNVPNEIKFDYTGLKRAIEGYTTGYKKLVSAGVDAVLLPETALPFIWDETPQNPSSFYSAILANNIPAWVGSFGKQGNSLTNSVFSINSKGEVISRYDKSKLVPLGEYIPLESFFGRVIERLSPLDAHLAIGKNNQAFETPFGKAIVGICYESAFADIFRRQARQGGQFILSAANNAHYNKSMPKQHHAQDVMRAIETDRWAVRATNTGYSAFVDPQGRTIWMSEINQYDLNSQTIYRRNTQTLYVRWGDWLTWMLLSLSVLGYTLIR